MDADRFDDFTARLAAPFSRRRSVGLLGLLGLGSLLAADDAEAKKKRKKKCKGGKTKCGKQCCPAGQFCRDDRCSVCAPPLFVCPSGACATELCGGACCGVAETCVAGQCVACPTLADSCLGVLPSCDNGSAGAVCRTSVEGRNVCTVETSFDCTAGCTTDAECTTALGVPAICADCAGCIGDARGCAAIISG